jgi:hypothetical protein
MRTKLVLKECPKCTCPVLNAPRADKPFCLEYPPNGFSPRVDTRDKNGACICPEGFQTGLVDM